MGFWILPWAMAWAIFSAGYHPQKGELISEFCVMEFRTNLGNLDREYWLKGLHESNPFEALDMPSSRGLWLVGDSFGGYMNRIFNHWMVQDSIPWKYHFDSNHHHFHWSPRRALMRQLSNPELESSGLTDVYLLELERQARVSSISMSKSNTKPIPVDPVWDETPERQTHAFFQFIFKVLLPWALDENSNLKQGMGTPVHPTIPLKLTDGSPIEKLTLLRNADPAWYGRPQWSWIENAILDYTRLDSICRTKGLNFTIVHIPDRSTVYAPWIDGQDSTSMRAHYRAFEKAIDDAGFQQMRVLDLFDAQHASGDSNLYMLHDNHWTEHGCWIVAKEILQEMAAAPPHNMRAE